MGAAFGAVRSGRDGAGAGNASWGKSLQSSSEGVTLMLKLLPKTELRWRSYGYPTPVASAENFP